MQNHNTYTHTHTEKNIPAVKKQATGTEIETVGKVNRIITLTDLSDS